MIEELHRHCVAIETVHIDPKNLNKHPPASIAALRAALGKHKQNQPLIARKSDRVIIIGNGRLQAARELGWQFVAVIFLDVDASTAAGISLTDNRVAQLSSLDLDLLRMALADTTALTIDKELETALLLAELCPPPTVETPAPPAGPPSAHYQVVIECSSPAEQDAVFRELMAKGHKARPHTS